MSSRPAAAQRLRDGWLRRVRDRIDREYAQSLDVEALARGAHMSAGTSSSRFTDLVGMPPSTYRRHAARATAGMPLCVAKPADRTGQESRSAGHRGHLE